MYTLNIQKKLFHVWLKIFISSLLYRSPRALCVCTRVWVKDRNKGRQEVRKAGKGRGRFRQLIHCDPVSGELPKEADISAWDWLDWDGPEKLFIGLGCWYSGVSFILENGWKTAVLIPSHRTEGGPKSMRWADHLSN